MRLTTFDTKLIAPVLGLFLYAQSIYAAPPVTLIPVAEYTNTGNVNDILLTEETVWVATDGGLVSYHRQHLKEQRRLTSKDGLFGNALRTLGRTGADTLMVGGDFGYARIDIGDKTQGAVITSARHAMTSFDPVVEFLTIDDALFALRFQSGLSPVKSAGKSKMIDPGKSFWNTAAVGGQMVALGAVDGTFVQYDLTQHRVVHTLRFATPVIQVVAYRRGFLVATQQNLYSCTDGIVHPVHISAGNKSYAIQATSVYPVTASHAFIGTADGSVLELKDGNVHTVAKYRGHRITAIASDGGQLWLGISQKGLARYTVASKETVYLQRRAEICSNHVTQSVYHGDTLVVRTFDRGACYLSAQGWKPLPAEKSRYVHGLASDGNTLVVTDSDGITLYDELFNPIDDARYLTGAMRWLGKSVALAVVSPRKGLFFIASPFGMAKLEQTHGRFRTTFWKKKRGIPGDITALAADADWLYIGTESRGVRVFTHDGKFVTDYMDPTHLPEPWTMSLATSQNQLIVGTCQHGVATITGGNRVTFHNAATGLADNRVIATAPFQDGAFVGSLHGLSYIDTTNGDAPFTRIFSPDPRTAALYVRHQTLFYGTEFGLIRYKISPA